MNDTNEQHGKFDTGYPHSLQPELHKALIARGIEYWFAQGITFWNRDDGCECLAYGYKANGVPKLAIKVVGFTDPEQAIAATLGDNDATRARQLDAIDEILRTLNAEVTNDNIKYDTYSELHDMVGELGNLIESCAEPIAGTCHMSIHVSFGAQSITDELREYIWQHATNNDELRAIADRIDEQFARICDQQEHVLQATIDRMTDAHRDEMQSVHDDMESKCNELAIELAKTKELLEISYAKRRALKLHIDQMKGGSKKWRKLYEDAQTLAEVNEQECDELLDLIRDAARDYKSLMAENDMNAVSRAAYQRQCGDVRKMFSDEAEDYCKLQAKYDMREGVLDAALAKLKDSVELPKDADGEAIRLGDTIYGYGKKHHVAELSLIEDDEWMLTNGDNRCFKDMAAFTHAEPITAESIVRDLTLGRIDEQEAVKLIKEMSK